MSVKLTILGCGASGGVPRIGNDWGVCDPKNPRNLRLRCSALIEQTGPSGTTTVLIDAGPDVRQQLLAANVRHLDGVLFTHDHADHTHGIDDLRIIAFLMKRRVDCYMDEATARTLKKRFGYCFETPKGGSYPPILNLHVLDPHQPVVVAGKGGPVEALPIIQEHGDITSLGFRIGPMAYSPDISALPDASRERLRGLDVWIVDALRYLPHPTHFSVRQAIEAIDRVAPKRGILTHLHIDLDYATLKGELPQGIEPAYDGMTVSW